MTWDFLRLRGSKSSKKRIISHDLECENAIIEEKARFGRVRTALMRELRSRYGEAVANRAMWRVNGRISRGVFTGDDRIDVEEKALKVAGRLRSISDLIREKKEESTL